jgi:hypothetical protein
MGRHPDIYMSPIKEPKYFTAQVLRFPLRGPGDAFVENFTVKGLREYRRLFGRVGHEEAVGEASVDNLYFHEWTIPLIRRRLGDPKIIVILRNPVDRAFSAYKNLLRDGRETLTFEEALDREGERKRKGYEYLWFYRGGSRYARQVAAFLKSFSKVKAMVLEDYRKGSPEIVSDLMGFLGVRRAYRPRDTQVFNVAGKPKRRWLQWAFNPTALKGTVYKHLVMNGVPEELLLTGLERLRQINIRPIRMRPETRERLTREFAPEVNRLEEILGRDLSVWRQ